MAGRDDVIEAMSRRPWDELIMLRHRAPMEAQGLLAPAEHRAYAREEVGRNPLMAVPYGVMVPGYQAYKALLGGLGLRGEGETGPSWDQLAHGYRGISDGVREWMRGRGAD